MIDKLRAWLQLLMVIVMATFSVSSGAEPNDKVTLSLQDADISELVHWAAQVTNKTVIIHPGVKGKVTVLSGEPMSREEAYQVFLSTLQVMGFTVVETGEALKVVPAIQAKENDIPFVEQANTGGLEEVVVRIIRVKNISATELVNLVKPMVPQFAYVAAFPASNAVIIADRANKISQLAGIIESLDQVGNIDIELIPLEFASATELSGVLAKLLPKSNPNDVQGVQLTVDERSNSILMTGDPLIRQQIKALVQRLDQPLAGEGNTHVIYLQYAKAIDMVPLLENLSGTAGEEKTRINKEDVSIYANESLNALVITAPPALLSTMKGVIAKMDVRRAQVLVEAIIVEVNRDAARDLGIEWRTETDLTESESVFAGFSNFPGNVSPLSFDTGEGTVSLGSGLSVGYFRGGNIRAILQLLEGEGNANVLSTPTILVLDNEEAQILVGSNVPFITGSLQREGDSDPFQTIQRQDIGVTLKIIPRINNSESVTLEIEQKVESLTQSSVQTADIITNKREIKTKVLIENNQVLALGGLIRDEVTESESKVPFLGDIPVLGRIFKSTSNTVVKNNLMVFIHPQIFRDPGSGKIVTEQRYKYMQENQDDFRSRVERYFIPGPIPKLPPLPESNRE